MKLQNLIEDQERKLGDLEINGELVAPNGVRREKWERDFSGEFYELTSLEGAPKHVDGHFWCHDNQLSSLKGAPQHVGKDFLCGDNKLTSLEGAPEYIGGDFLCNGNQLKSLEEGPQRVGKNFECSFNQITSLVGAPQYISLDFWCNNNQLTSLEGAPQHIGGNLWCSNNRIESLENIHEQILEINGIADFESNPIKSHVLGLLLIKSLKKVNFDNRQLANIINKYLPLGDIMACQNELIDAGLEEFAQI